MNEPTPTPVEDDAVPTRRRLSRHSRIAALTIAAAVLLTTGAGAGAWAATSLRGSTTSTAAQSGPWSGGTSSGGSSSGGTAGGGFGGFSQGGFSGGGPQGGTSGGAQGGFSQGGSSTGSSATDSTTATAAQSTGVVTITTVLKYDDGEAAGTGIVLTSSGRILTNNHVVEGATSIKVTDETTGRTYTAEVVGTDAKKDVAVLQLEGASGLTTATIADTAAATGDAVTAIGNAGGTGTLTAAKGTVTDTDQQITTEAEASAASESLTGLIETDADIVAGDSGGPMKNAAGEVVGIDTAASSGTAEVTGYAIPIATALSIAQKIVDGDAGDGIVIGYPAFIGVGLSSNSTSPLVAEVFAGTPAATAGLAEGDTITAVGGTAVASDSALSAAMAKHHPGDRVSISWTDTSGAAHTATVTLMQGPAA